MMRIVTWTLVLAVLLFTAAGAEAAKGKKPGKKPAKSPEKRFAKADVNSDGKLSLEEFIGKRTDDQKAKATKRFGKVDKNHDNFVTLDEFKAAAKGKSGSA
jgi:Ca2+-binding EF-hand superfamily protein